MFVLIYDYKEGNVAYGVSMDTAAFLADELSCIAQHVEHLTYSEFPKQHV